jgi:hypothetical protein
MSLLPTGRLRRHGRRCRVEIRISIARYGGCMAKPPASGLDPGLQHALQDVQQERPLTARMPDAKETPKCRWHDEGGERIKPEERRFAADKRGHNRPLSRQGQERKSTAPSRRAPESNGHDAHGQMHDRWPWGNRGPLWGAGQDRRCRRLKPTCFRRGSRHFPTK